MRKQNNILQTIFDNPINNKLSIHSKHLENREIALAFASKLEAGFELLPEKFTNDATFINELLKTNPYYALPYITIDTMEQFNQFYRLGICFNIGDKIKKTIENNSTLLDELINLNGDFLYEFDNLIDNKEYYIKALQSKQPINRIPTSFLNNKTRMVELLKIRGDFFNYTNPALRKDEEVIKAAIEGEPLTILFLSDKILTKDLFNQAFSKLQNKDSFCIPNKFRKEKKFLIELDTISLVDIPAKMCRDKDIVLKALHSPQYNGEDFNLIGSNLINDKEIQRIAIRKDASSFKVNDYETIKEFVNISPVFFNNLPEEFKNIEELKLINASLCKDTTFITELLKDSNEKENVYQIIDPSILYSAEIKKAIKENLNTELLNIVDKDLRLEILNDNINYYYDLYIDEINKDDVLLFLEKTDKIFNLYHLIPECYQEDKDIALKTMKISPYHYSQLTNKLRNDPDIKATIHPTQLSIKIK